jgi:hypothetical protein
LGPIYGSQPIGMFHWTLDPWLKQPWIKFPYFVDTIRGESEGDFIDNFIVFYLIGIFFCAHKINWPITNPLPMTEHFGKSFSILLHFEWFQML